MISSIKIPLNQLSHLQITILGNLQIINLKVFCSLCKDLYICISLCKRCVDCFTLIHEKSLAHDF